MTIPPLARARRGRAPPRDPLPRPGLRGVPPSLAKPDAGGAGRAARLPVARERARARERDGARRAPVRGAGGDRGAARAAGHDRARLEPPRRLPPTPSAAGVASARRCARQRGAGPSRRGPPPDGGKRDAGRGAARHLAGHPPVPDGQARPGSRRDGAPRPAPEPRASPGATRRRAGADAPVEAARVTRAGVGCAGGRDRGAARGPVGGPAARVPPERRSSCRPTRSRIQPEPRARGAASRRSRPSAAGSRR